MVSPILTFRTSVYVGQRGELGCVTLQMALEFYFKGQRAGADHADEVKRYFAWEEVTYEKSGKSTTAQV